MGPFAAILRPVGAGRPVEPSSSDPRLTLDLKFITFHSFSSLSPGGSLSLVYCIFLSKFEGHYYRTSSLPWVLVGLDKPWHCKQVKESFFKVHLHLIKCHSETLYLFFFRFQMETTQIFHEIPQSNVRFPVLFTGSKGIDLGFQDTPETPISSPEPVQFLALSPTISSLDHQEVVATANSLDSVIGTSMYFCFKCRFTYQFSVFD